MMIRNCFYILFIISAGKINAQKPEFDISLFESAGILNMEITMPFDSIFKGPDSENVLYSGKLKYFDAVLKTYKNIPIKISKRGNFRKQSSNCSFPPLRLHFTNKETTKGTDLEGIKKLKLVTHCQTDDSLFNQYVLQEYYLYRIYNCLTHRSFKVRLAKCNYTDLLNLNPSIQRWGFFIENPQNLAYRNNGELLNFKYLTAKAVNPYYYALNQLFQAMIINSDWSLVLLHNIELMGIHPDFQPITIPFDFDMAGIIHIPYNSPSVAFKKNEKPFRKYTFYKPHSKGFKNALIKIKGEKQNILSLLTTDTLLNTSFRNHMINSVTEFYNDIENKTYLKKVRISQKK